MLVVGEYFFHTNIFNCHSNADSPLSSITWGDYSKVMFTSKCRLMMDGGGVMPSNVAPGADLRPSHSRLSSITPLLHRLIAPSPVSSCHPHLGCSADSENKSEIFGWRVVSCFIVLNWSPERNQLGIMNLFMGVSIVLLTNAELMFTGTDNMFVCWVRLSDCKLNGMCYPLLCYLKTRINLN